MEIEEEPFGNAFIVARNKWENKTIIGQRAQHQRFWNFGGHQFTTG